MPETTTEIVREISTKQIAELRELFAKHEITHLGRVDSDGRLIVEYIEFQMWAGDPKGNLKILIINR